MDTTLNWGILSTGRIAGTFARGLKTSKTGRLVAVASRSAASAEKFGTEHDVPHRHATYEELLANPEVDAVYIATPHPQHAEWAIKTAEAGKHVLCEKPLTINHGQAMAVIEAARENGVVFMEAFMYRCHPQTAKLLELIREKAIGEIRVIQATFSFGASFDADSRLFDNDYAGGGILDVGCYPVSMSRLIAGAANGQPFAEPTEVCGVGHLGQTGIDEYTVATMKFPGEILAQLSTGITLGQESVVRIFGTTGQIFIPSPWLCTPTDGAVKIIVSRGGANEEIIVETDRDLYAYEADTFAASVAAGAVSPPAMTPEDSLGDIAALDRWRAAIGLTYESEKPGRHQPVRGHLARRADAPMRYGQINGLDKPVSRLALGCDNQTVFAAGAAIFDDYYERGGNTFDTAYIYGGGRCEPVFGQWVKARNVRDDIVIIGKGAHSPNCNPEALTRQLHESLERMQLEAVDIYMMHRDNPEIPVGEFVDVLNEHLKAGRFKVFGGSNWSVERVQAANEYAKAKGLTGFGALSNNFSLARMVDPVWEGCVSASDPISRAWLVENQLPNFAWSSQARGFFVHGARHSTADADQARCWYGDVATDADLVRCWYSDDNFQRLERARELAAKKGTTAINIAAAYVLSQDFPSFALIGPRTIAETRSSLGALSIELTPEEVRWLNLEA